MRDSPLVVITILWVVALGVLIARFDPGSDGVEAVVPVDCATQPAPETLPTELRFGAELDGPGRIAEPHARFPSESGIAFLACLPAPSGSDEVELELLRLLSDGGNEAVWEREPFQIERGPRYVAGEIPPHEVVAWGDGTFRLRIMSEGDVLAGGGFQIATSIPESIDAFADWLPATLVPGEHVGYRFDESGTIVEEHAASVAEPTPTQVVRRATFDGTSYLLVTEGIWARYWLPEGDAVILEDEA